MRKTRILSLFLLLALISSCRNNSASVSPTSPSAISKNSQTGGSHPSSTSHSSSVSSPSSPSVLTQELIQDTLSRMKQGNFTLEYDIGSNHFKDVLTDRYFYTGYINTGSVLLRTFSDTPISYDFQLVDDGNDIELKGQTFNSEQTAQGLTDISYANKLKNLDVTDIETFQEGNVFKVMDSDVVNALANQLDFNGSLVRADFYMENGKIVFELKDFDSTTNKYFTPEGGKVTISDVGSSSLEAMENFLASYKRPTENLVSKADNLFGNVYFESAVYDYTLDYNRADLKGYSNLEIYQDFIRKTEINDEGIPYIETYHKNSDNTLNVVGVNARNEVVDRKTTKTFDDFRLVGKDGFELNLFCKIREDDEYYLYLGSDAKKLAYSITQSSIFSKYPCLKIQAKVSEGKVTELHFYTGVMQDRDTGEYFFYRIDTMVHEANVIEPPTKKIPSKDDSKIKGYLSNLNQNDSVFKVTVEDSAWEGNAKTEYLKGKDFYIKKDYAKSGENMNPTLIRGYYKKNGKIYPFSYDYEEKVELSGAYEERELKDIVGFSLSSEVLSLEGDKISTTGDILDLGKSIAFSSYPDYLDPTSFVMNVTNGRISNLSYEYGGSGFSGNETFAFDYSDVTMDSSLKSSLDEKINALPQKLTWEANNKSMYEEMVDYFGEEFASKIPYLNTNLVFDHGMDDGIYFGVYISSADIGDYITRYKAYLLTLGYTSNDDTTFVNEKDKVKLVVSTDKDEFLSIYKL